MSLTREQYNSVMNILSSRRNEAYKRQSRRQEEVERQIPAIRVYNERIAEYSLKAAEAGFRNKAEAEKYREMRRQAVCDKIKLLENNGFSSDYLDLHYFCDECGDTGYIGHEKCGCLKRLESEELNRESGLPALLGRENFASFDPYIYDDAEDIKELYPKKLTQYEYMREVVMGHVREFIDDFEISGGNILMMGPPGTGKTFLSNCIAKALIDRQHTVLYQRSGEMFEKMSAQVFSRTRDEEFENIVERIENCELLIIDDLGTEFITDYSRSKLFTIISNRLSRRLSTIISTNLSLNQLSSIYGERVTSRFIGEYRLIPFYGADLRERKQEA